MRCCPPPLRVISPFPSMTILGPVSLTTLAVPESVIVVGFGPQLKVITPPLATAAMNAAPVQLAGVPVPTTVLGVELSSGPAPAGTAQVASGLGFPAGGRLSGGFELSPP